MKYALWNLDSANQKYQTGPEEEIMKAGGIAESAWANGEVELGADILGYITADFSGVDLTGWNYREITQQEALAFCLAINPEAYLLDDGRIGSPRKDWPEN